MTAADVSVVILNYQRADTLRRALAAAVRQDPPARELLVVDNASTDGSAEMVEREFPGARLLRLPANVGCAARNAGVRAARGAVVVTLDNDVLLEDAGAMASVAAVFAARPGLACADFRILDAEGALSRRDWCHPRDWRRSSEEQFPTDYVLEGACAFRREAFLAAGGYWAPLFIGHEGWDLALRLLDAGHEVLYTPRVRVRHLASAEARPTERIYYTFTRNAVWVALRNYGLFAAMGVIARDLALMAFSSLRARHPSAFLRGVRDGLGGWTRARATARPLRPETRARLRARRRHEPGLLRKAVRHWKERPI